MFIFVLGDVAGRMHIFFVLLRSTLNACAVSVLNKAHFGIGTPVKHVTLPTHEICFYCCIQKFEETAGELLLLTNRHTHRVMGSDQKQKCRRRKMHILLFFYIYF